MEDKKDNQIKIEAAEIDIKVSQLGKKLCKGLG